MKPFATLLSTRAVCLGSIGRSFLLHFPILVRFRGINTQPLHFLCTSTWFHISLGLTLIILDRLLSGFIFFHVSEYSMAPLLLHKFSLDQLLIILEVHIHRTS